MLSTNVLKFIIVLAFIKLVHGTVYLVDDEDYSNIEDDQNNDGSGSNEPNCELSCETNELKHSNTAILYKNDFFLMSLFSMASLFLK